MDSAVYYDGTKFRKEEFNLEDSFEKEVKTNSKRLFGEKTIYLDIKKKIETNFLGNSIPDGILLDLEDPDDIKFYLVEVELSKHSFYEHIFPQITRFFGFFKNSSSRNNLTEKVFRFIMEEPNIKKELQNLLGAREIYKALKDAIENNQKILLILDNEKPEIKEVQSIYTGTWDKLITLEILNKYSSEGKEVFVLTPDFKEEKDLEIEEIKKELEELTSYSESYHLEDTNPQIEKIYLEIKNRMWKLNEKMIFNPQKYYISIREKRNFAYLSIKKKKIKIAIMLPFEIGTDLIKFHRLRKFTEGIQRFYGRPSFEVTIEDEKNIEEIFNLLEEAYKEQDK